MSRVRAPKPRPAPDTPAPANVQQRASHELSAGPGWTLHRGDCIEGMRALADDSVDVTITDPPYSKHTHAKQWRAAALSDGTIRHPSAKSSGGGLIRSQHTGLNFEHLTREQAFMVAAESARLTKRWSLFFADLEGIQIWIDAVTAAGLEHVRTCIWDKVDGAPQFTGDRPAAGAEAIIVAHRPEKKRWNGGGRRNVFRYEVNATSGGPAHKPHPTTKPQALMHDLVALFSEPGELILDGFAGSGSTGVAALALDRRFLGWELAQCARCPAGAEYECSWTEGKTKQRAFLCLAHRDEVSLLPGFTAVEDNYFRIACRRLRGDEAKPNPAQPSLFGGL